MCNFFRKPQRNKNIRKRPTEEEEDDDDGQEEADVSAIQRKKKPSRADNKLHFSSSDSSTKKVESVEVETVFHFESSKEIQVQSDNRATASLETETAFDRDARAIRERTLKQAEENLKGDVKSDGKVYRGIHGYTDYKAGFRREQTVASEKAGGAHGPLRASAHIRTSMRFDYQPDICKDYKETGYCGYGDSCKFMHDRGDYKSGWQLEKEWEEAEKERKKKMVMGLIDDSDVEEASEEDEDSLPFACFICREPFTLEKNPVVTKCKHYFCESCALQVSFSLNFCVSFASVKHFILFFVQRHVIFFFHYL